MFKGTLGARIRAARQFKGWHQTQLARMLGVSKSTVSSIETNQQDPRFSQVEHLARLLGVTVANLAGEALEQSVQEMEMQLLKKFRQIPQRHQRFILLEVEFFHRNREKQ